MTFGYDADIVDFKKMASKDNLRANAKSLLEALSEARDARQGVAASSRPLYFVTHSLGGLLCKQALILASSRPQYRPIFDAYAGIIFIGTPHKGSKQARLGGALISMVNVFRPANLGLVYMLKDQSPELSALDDDFWTLMDGNKKGCHVHCYHESAPMAALGIIVSSESASRPGGSSSSLVGNHSNMLKFGSNSDAGYLNISAKLSTWIDVLMPPASNVQSTEQAAPRRDVAEADSKEVMSTEGGRTEAIPTPTTSILAIPTEANDTGPVSLIPDNQQPTPTATQTLYNERVANQKERPKPEGVQISTKFKDCYLEKSVPGPVNNDTMHINIS